MLKCCAGSRLGYERRGVRRECSRDQSAGVSPRAELALWGGRRAVNGRKVGPRRLAESSWRRGRAHFRWLVSGFAESGRALGWFAETEARYNSVVRGSKRRLRAVGLTGRGWMEAEARCFGQ